MLLEGEYPVDGVVLNPRMLLLLLGGKTFAAAGKGKIQPLLPGGGGVHRCRRGLDVVVACFGGLVIADVVFCVEGFVVAEVEYENNQRKIPVFKSSSLILNYIRFNFQRAVVRCCQASFFPFFLSEVWFLISRHDISFNDNLLVEL